MGWHTFVPLRILQSTRTRVHAAKRVQEELPEDVPNRNRSENLDEAAETPVWTSTALLPNGNSLDIPGHHLVRACGFHVRLDIGILCFSIVISFHTSWDIYIYVYTCICMYVYIYIHLYECLIWWDNPYMLKSIHLYVERHPPGPRAGFKPRVFHSPDVHRMDCRTRRRLRIQTPWPVCPAPSRVTTILGGLRISRKMAVSKWGIPPNSYYSHRQNYGKKKVSIYRRRLSMIEKLRTFFFHNYCFHNFHNYFLFHNSVGDCMSIDSQFECILRGNIEL